MLPQKEGHIQDNEHKTAGFLIKVGLKPTTSLGSFCYVTLSTPHSIWVFCDLQPKCYSAAPAFVSLKHISLAPYSSSYGIQTP